MTTSEILLYQSPNGNIKIDVRLEDETVWLTQAQMGQLFGKGRTTIYGTYRQYICRRRIAGKSGMPEFPTYHSTRRYGRENTGSYNKTLQS